MTQWVVVGRLLLIASTTSSIWLSRAVAEVAVEALGVIRTLEAAGLAAIAAQFKGNLLAAELLPSSQKRLLVMRYIRSLSVLEHPPLEVLRWEIRAAIQSSTTSYPWAAAVGVAMTEATQLQEVPAAVRHELEQLLPEQERRVKVIAAATYLERSAKLAQAAVGQDKLVGTAAIWVATRTAATAWQAASPARPPIVLAAAAALVQRLLSLADTLAAWAAEVMVQLAAVRRQASLDRLTQGAVAAAVTAPLEVPLVVPASSSSAILARSAARAAR